VTGVPPAEDSALIDAGFGFALGPVHLTVLTWARAFGGTRFVL
jgi:hypothetical protein